MGAGVSVISISTGESTPHVLGISITFSASVAGMRHLSGIRASLAATLAAATSDQEGMTSRVMALRGLYVLNERLPEYGRSNGQMT